MSAQNITVVPRTEPVFNKAEDVQKIVRNNLPVMRTVMIYVQAKPLHSLITVPVENLLTHQEGGICAALAIRFNYIETGMISFACLIYNFFMAIGATVLAAITCGQNDNINHAFNKHWTHTAIAASGLVISALGCVSPLVATCATAGLLSLVITRLRSAWSELKLPSNEERMAIVRSLYELHREDIAQGLQELVSDSEKASQMIDKIEHAVKNARSIEDFLMKCLRGVVHEPAAQT